MKRKLSLRRETIRQLSAMDVRRVVGALPPEGATDYCGTDSCPCGTGAESVCQCLYSGGGKTCPHYGGGGSG